MVVIRNVLDFIAESSCEIGLLAYIIDALLDSAAALKVCGCSLVRSSEKSGKLLVGRPCGTLGAACEHDKPPCKPSHRQSRALFNQSCPSLAGLESNSEDAIGRGPRR